jgi:DNA-binding transcriptional regulator GbsR (MarR family)
MLSHNNITHINNNFPNESEFGGAYTRSIINTLSTNNEEDENSSSNNNLIDVKDKINKNLNIIKLLEKAIEIFKITKSSSECFKFLPKEKMIFRTNF